MLTILAIASTSDFQLKIREMQMFGFDEKSYECC